MPHAIYLDHNATAPPLAEVLAVMTEVQQRAWANPASVHRAGQRARAELDGARAALAELTGFEAQDVVLTSGGTEANNLALAQLEHGPGGLLLSRLEHPSVAMVAEVLEERGTEVCWVSVAQDGRVNVDAFERAMASMQQVRLVSLQAVNHETGVIQAVAEVAELAHRCGALMHVDAVQAVGKIAPESWAGADMLSVAAHKIGGPKGIGALLSRPGVRLKGVLRGGGQERGLRPGTQCAALAAGFAVAARHAKLRLGHDAELRRLRDKLELGLLALGHDRGIAVQRNGSAERVAHVSNLSWAGWRGPELCAALDLEGLAVSSGAACSAGTSEPSTVIAAIAGATRAGSALRISLGEQTSEAEIDGALEAFRRVLSRSALAG